MRLRALELFSGIGGFSIGLERAGLAHPVGFVEIDPFCQRVLAKHWPDVPIHGDVTTREFIEGEADVITGGFPCQDVSLAGKRAGLSGARSGLYRHVIRAIRVVRPKFAILENVAALLSGWMGDVLGDLAEVGYDAEWHCIPASAVGAPHQRDRVWIIANPRSEQHESSCPPLSGTLAEELSRAYLANAPRERCGETRELRHIEQEEWFASGSEALADSDCSHAQGGVDRRSDAQERSGSIKRQAGLCGFGERGAWTVEPDIRRVAHGVPSRSHRLRQLGNAVVPQVVEVIGRAIAARHALLRRAA